MASTTEKYNPGQFSTPEPGGRFQAAASHLIHEGHLIMVLTTGTGVVMPAAPTANYRFVGVSSETVDNSAGSAGDLDVPVVSGDFSFDMKSGDTFDEGDVGAPAYADTSTTVKKTAGSDSILVGYVRGIAADGRCIVRCSPGGN